MFVFLEPDLRVAVIDEPDGAGRHAAQDIMDLASLHQHKTEIIHLLKQLVMDRAISLYTLSPFITT